VIPLAAFLDLARPVTPAEGGVWISGDTSEGERILFVPSVRKKDRLRGNSGPSVSGVQKPFPRSKGRSVQRLGSHATETGLRLRSYPR
jgi:hypothetical protein